MYTIHAHSVDIKALPETMLRTVKHHQELGDLDDLIHAKDDIVRKFDYGWEMLSCWDTPEEIGNVE